MRLNALAALCALAALPALAADPPPPLTCFGAEPFWSLELDDDGAALHAPGAPEILYAIADMRDAVGRSWPKAVTLLARDDTAILIVRPAACSDGMSDRSYDWMADLLTQRGGEAVILTGCCRAADD